jgi:ribosomal protein S18 acetylase RimI-like enzyme
MSGRRSTTRSSGKRASGSTGRSRPPPASPSWRARPPAADIALDALGPDDPRLEDVRRLFQAMYDFQESVGLLVPLAPDGAARWLAGIRPSLGRLGVLLAASEPGGVVGFLHAGLYPLPEYLGGGRGARITHVFVAPEARGVGVGSRLVAAALDWLRERGVGSVDLQVLVGNTEAIAFWRSLGWELELHQMRLELGSSPPGRG